MKIAYISTYMPRPCGLATFNSNLKNAIEINLLNKNQGGYVIAINDSDELNQYQYGKEVKYIIRQQHQKDYIQAANQINNSAADVCVMQHEFGIYGGDSGIYVLPLIKRIEKPLITILHTVLQDPSYIQKLIIQEIANQSSRIVVMAEKAVDFLMNIYHIPKEKIALIEHGVPDYDDSIEKILNKADLLPGKRVLLTFGLISRNKGLETMIKALPAVVKNHPDVVYTIIGKTHPHVLKNQGEEYRDYLKKLASDLGVSKNVNFINKFLAEDELMDYLKAAEIYITPYLNEAQITSGTLSYAVGAGAAVISTPYWHAQELLKNNRGKLFDFGDSEHLASIINDLLTNDKSLKDIRDNAYAYGLTLRYPKIGNIYLNLAKEIVSENNLRPIVEKFTLNTDLLPAFTLDYVKRLTDDTGIVQHAKYGIPNLKEGYCMDDNSRALILALMSYNQFQSKEALDLLPIYLSFIQYMQCENGNFRNFLSFKREYLDEVGTDDSYGRTLWALGFMICNSPNNSYKEFARELFFNSLEHLDELEHLRGFGNSIIGLAHYLKTYPDENLEIKLIALADKLVNAYQINKSENWHWFEEKMTYDNAILPLALLKTYDITKNVIYKEIGIESLTFLDKETLDQGYYNPIGNDGWFYKNQDKAIFDQQAIETMAAVMMYFQAFEVTEDVIYIEKMFKTYLWFLGENALRIPLYDHETNGCCDGLTPHGINRNQGAESTLAYFISHLTVLKAQEKEYLFDKTIMGVSRD
ncbi:glycosyl transferase [Pedobacter psychrophilus]|uniref:Glycosyl transferase n=1 Tax=Pedobacter psychrophilus TaxID=1826909 RepID=A0A179DM57_9SPHI|nr:glycosyltransferase family 4 protein [Pedobacter psychrophilus]OAQ42135.1 glycosyl transferase [Pedobacter psychrophilus]